MHVVGTHVGTRAGLLSSALARGLVVAAAVLAAACALAMVAATTASAKEHVKAKHQHGTLTVTGTGAADTIVLRLKAGDPTRLEVVGNGDVTDIKRDKFDEIVVEAGGGNDSVSIDESNGTFTDTEQTTLDGQDGNDTLLGGSGVETFIGGAGDDFADGNRGNDVAFMGAGDDTFRWDPGDGNDTVEGQAGDDRLLFNGAGAPVAENVTISANPGGRVTFFRTPGNVTMDLNGVEQTDFNALGGVDNVTVNDLTGTDLKTVNNDLAGTLGGSAGDGAADAVIVNGTNGNDSVAVAGDPASGVSVTGLPARVNITHSEAANDSLTVNGQGGNDALSAGNGLAAFLKPITLDGGANDDTLTGGNGIETLIGGDGNDFADGNQGNDTGLMGAGDDTFQWDPGDGNDTVEGQAGHDTLRFNGAGVPVVENVTISANPGGRVTFFRTPGNVTMDLNGVEQIDFNALGGADVVGVNNLAGTDVTRVNTDLAGTLGGSAGDGAPDVVNVLGTPGNDNITVAGDATSLATVSGLPATVGVSHSDGLGDTLDVNADGGTNTADLTGFVAGSIQLVLHL